MSAIVVQTEFLGKAHMLPNFSHLRNKGKKKEPRGPVLLDLPSTCTVTFLQAL